MTVPDDDAHGDEPSGWPAAKAWLVELVTQLVSELSIAWLFAGW